MIYTPNQLKEMIQPMIESVITKQDAEDCTDAIVDLIEQDRQAHATA